MNLVPVTRLSSSLLMRLKVGGLRICPLCQPLKLLIYELALDFIAAFKLDNSFLTSSLSHGDSSNTAITNKTHAIKSEFSFT